MVPGFYEDLRAIGCDLDIHIFKPHRPDGFDELSELDGLDGYHPQDHRSENDA